ncbi:MAG: M20 family metallopeptidase [Halieaceae bacterium]|nr:M20 family metallopeptidase [Halieaceae bacterium]
MEPRNNLSIIWQLSLLLAAVALYAVPMTSAKAEDQDRMVLTAKGHGVLFDGEARNRAGISQDIADYVWGLQDQLSAYRRDLHKIPEIGFREFDTHTYLMKTLTNMGYKPQKVGDTTGIIVDVPGVDTSFTIGVRADIDALPITEVDDGRAYRSTREGYMHACGHDGHTAIALGIAKAYADGNIEPPVNLRFIFQPAEELGAGAKKLVEEGVLEGVDIIIGLHADPNREWGTVGLTENYWSAFVTGFTYEVTGVAAHAGIEPEKGKDAIVTGSYIVTQLQSIVARNIPAAAAGVVSVGMFTAGSVANQIADKAVLSGTSRAENKALHEQLKKRMAEIGEGTERSMGMPVKFEVVVEAPGVRNNEAMFKLARDTSEHLLGESNVDVYTSPNMGGEDFAYYTEVIPGFFYWLGVANNAKNIQAGLHTPGFDMDERALVVGTALQLANIKALADYKQRGGDFQ